MSLALTPNEAAFTVGRDVDAVQRAVDSGVVEKRTRTIRGRERRVFGRSELRFFKVVAGVEDDLTKKGRRKLYEAILHPRGQKVSVGPFEVDIADVDRQIEDRLADLQRIRGVAATGPEGTVVLRGTSIPVHVVAALAEAGGPEAAERAYPSLSKTDVETAVQYATVYPKKGRPYPKKSLKQMLGELALPDEVFGGSEGKTGPRVVRL